MSGNEKFHIYNKKNNNEEQNWFLFVEIETC